MIDNRLAIAYIYTDATKALAASVIPVAEHYCAEHGYHLAHQEVPYSTPQLSFKMLEMVEKVFSSADVDYVWMLNADTIIMSSNPVHTLIPKDAFFIIEEDIRRSFIVKRSANWEDLRDYCYGMRLVYDDLYDAISSYNRKKHRPKIHLLRTEAQVGSMFNLTDTPEMPMSKRIRAFKEFADLLKTNG